MSKNIASNVVPGTLTIDKCVEPSCLDCSTSIDTCEKCDKTKSNPYHDPVTNTCTDSEKVN